MSDALSFLALPFAACAIFVAIHAFLGLHVLRRQIIFADLALAQLSALGATVAFAAGYAPASPGGFAYTILFTGLGAILLALSRHLPARIGQEAFIGILYVVGTAATILIVDRSPQGAEHVKKMLVGNILTVGGADLETLVFIYAPIALFLWLARRPILELSGDSAGAARPRAAIALWDFAFYLAFGVVVSSSVATAGVLLVFCFLIVPAVAGTVFSARLGVQLAIGWVVGGIASLIGLGASYEFDLPTGATLVVAFVGLLLAASLAKLLIFSAPASRSANLRAALRIVLGSALAAALVASLWLIVAPRADQPLLAVIEDASGIGPQRFMTPSERAAFTDALGARERYRREAERLNVIERDARWQGASLAADEVRRLGSYVQSFNEMEHGENFVADFLRGRARERERWYVGVPLAALSLGGLVLLIARSARRRPRQIPPAARPAP